MCTLMFYIILFLFILTCRLWSDSSQHSLHDTDLHLQVWRCALHSASGGVEAAASCCAVCSPAAWVENICHTEDGIWKPQQGTGLCLSVSLCVSLSPWSSVFLCPGVSDSVFLSLYFSVWVCVSLSLLLVLFLSLSLPPYRELPLPTDAQFSQGEPSFFVSSLSLLFPAWFTGSHHLIISYNRPLKVHGTGEIWMRRLLIHKHVNWHQIRFRV